MPRTKLSAERDSLRDLTGEIRAQGCRYGYRSCETMGPLLGVSPGTAAKYIESPEEMRLKTLRGMVKALRLDPRIVLAALGYSGATIKQIIREADHAEA